MALVTTLYVTSSRMVSVNAVNLGDISNWIQGYTSDHGYTQASNLDIIYNADDVDMPAATLLNGIDIDGATSLSLYGNSSLISAVNMSQKGGDPEKFINISLSTPGMQYAGTLRVSYGDGLSYISNAYLARATINGTVYMGIATFSLNPNRPNKIGFLTNSTWSEAIYEELEFSRKGSRPIGDIGKHQRGGGDGDGGIPSYYTDTINLPGEPDESKASAVGAGFITAYDITEGMLTNLGKVLYDPSYLSGIANFFINPLDAVISLNVFPYTPHLAASTYVKLLKYYCKSEYFGVDVTAFPLAKQFRTISFGTLQIPEVWQSFLDYEATSISLYLPFIGEVSLDASDVMGGSITVEYTIDFFTGMCVANVSCERGLALDDTWTVPSRSVHSYQGNCAIQIPLSAADYGSMVGALVSAASAGLSTGLAGVGMSLASSVASGAFKPTITSKGTISANAGYCSVLYPYIIITRPITAEPFNYQTVMGYPSYVNGRLADYEDLCICDEIDLTAITSATRSELDEIRQLCKEGVYV